MVKMPKFTEHRPPRCRDDDCQRPGCVWYKRGYDDGWTDGYAAASGEL
jgi:hypothetical protein